MRNGNIKIEYNEKLDRFELWLINKGVDDWGLVVAVKCVPCVGGNGETDYIHYSILHEIRKFIACGYDLI